MGRSGLDDPIVRESFYTNESPPSPRPCRANRDSPQRLSAFPPSVLVRNNQPLILRASSTPRGRKISLVRWITYGRKKNTGERMCFFSLWKLFSKIRSGLILTALKSAILVSLGTVTMSTTGVLWPCPGVYRHQLKVDIMTEICGGHVRLPSQHNTSSRRKKEKREVLVEREVDMWWVEVCISQTVPNQHLKLTDIEQENWFLVWNCFHTRMFGAEPIVCLIWGVWFVFAQSVWKLFPNLDQETAEQKMQLKINGFWRNLNKS